MLSRNLFLKKQKGETSKDWFVEDKIGTTRLFLQKFSCTLIKIGLQLSVSQQIIHTNQPPHKCQSLSLQFSFNSNSYMYLFWFTEVCKQLTPLNTRHWWTRYIVRTHVLDFRKKLNIIKQGIQFWYEVERGSANLLIFVEQTLNNISHTVWLSCSTYIRGLI